MDPITLLGVPFHYVAHHWAEIPEIARTGIRLLLSFVFAYFVGRRIAGKSVRFAVQIGIIGVMFILPFVVFAIEDYKRQRPFALNPQCTEIAMTALAVAPSAPIAADGFLIATDYDGIGNSRRINEIPDHPGRNLLNRSTFDEMAQVVLLEWKYSFVEFEMKLRSKQDPMFPGEYSNLGHLNSQGWSGDRYRLYYLAPRGHPNCIKKLGFDSAPSRGDEGATQGVSASDNTPAGEPTRFCLALEIKTAPTSKYRLVALDVATSLPWTVHTQGFRLKALADARLDDLEITASDASKPLARYEGLHALVDGKVVQSCGNRSGIKNILVSTLMPDAKRTFYKATDWYGESAVERYYEPTGDLSASVREPFSDKFKMRDPATMATYEGKRCVEFMDTVESKVAFWIEMAKQGSGCTQIDNIKVTCEYRKGYGPRETWTYQLCGRPGGKSTNETSYDPKLHGGLDLESIPEYKEQRGKTQ